MYLQNIDEILDGQFVGIKYDCDGGFERCGKNWEVKLKDAKANAIKNDGRHICRSCQMSANNPARKKDVQDKIKKTNLEKYGCELPMNSSENIQRRREQFQDESFRNQWIEKHRETCIEKYGVDHPMKTENVKQSVKRTMQERFGVDHPYQSEEIMSKMRQANLEKYGVEYVGRLPDVKIKMAETMLEKYGVKYYNQLPEMKEYMRENCHKWLSENWDNPWNRGFVRPEEWNDRQRQTVISLILEGKWFGGYGKGKIQGWITHPNKKCKKQRSYFRSYLELFAHIHFNENENVEWYDFEPFSIPYQMSDGNQHEYVVDFATKFFDDPRIHLIETKPRFKKDDPKVELKAKAGLQLADVCGMVYEYYDEYFINSLGYDLDAVKKLPFVEMKDNDLTSKIPARSVD
jgi:hypothetical protein